MMDLRNKILARQSFLLGWNRHFKSYHDYDVPREVSDNVQSLRSNVRSFILRFGDGKKSRRLLPLVSEGTSVVANSL